MRVVIKKKVVFAAILLAFPAISEERLGRETGLPIPRYVSINSDEANMRRGPDLEYAIDWVYERKGLPVRVIAESNHWRKVEDNEGVTGWFHYALLSGRRTALVSDDQVTLFDKPNLDEIQNAIVKKGNVLYIEQCRIEWCFVEIGQYDGWVKKTAIWGVDAGEVFE